MSTGKEVTPRPDPEPSFAEAAVLRLLSGVEEPKGARVLARELAPERIVLSEASVSRALTRLDSWGLTMPVGRKGRVLTEHGRRWVLETSRRHSRATELSSALDVTHIDQLIDLLRARRGLEREIIHLAVERATEDDLDDLEQAWAEHSDMSASSDYRSRVANYFHKLLVRTARSQLFETLSSVILYDALDDLDPLLFLITSWNGTVREAPDEHRRVIDAIRSRDGVTAQRMLDEHLSRLVREVEDFRDKDQAGLFTSLLSLTGINRNAQVDDPAG